MIAYRIPTSQYQLPSNFPATSQCANSQRVVTNAFTGRVKRSEHTVTSNTEIPAILNLGGDKYYDCWFLLFKATKRIPGALL